MIVKHNNLGKFKDLPTEKCIKIIEQLLTPHNRLYKTLLPDVEGMRERLKAALVDPYGKTRNKNTLDSRRYALKVAVDSYFEGYDIIRKSLIKFLKERSHRKTICEREFKKFLSEEYKADKHKFLQNSEWVRETFEWAIKQKLVKRPETKNNMLRLDYYHICKETLLNEQDS